MFEIKEIQPAERTGFPPAHFPAQDLVSDLPFRLSRQKGTEMVPKELLKLLQIAIVIARPGEVSLAVLFPMRKELL